MANRIAFVFPGQGSQFVGMGRKAVETSAVARATFDEADRLLGQSISRLCFEGPIETLTDTINAQPAILTVSIAYWRMLQEAEPVRPTYLAGHSMGEYTALVAAGALSFADGLRLVRERGRLMKEAGKLHPGQMAAVIGLDTLALEQVCREASGTGELEGVQIANYNAPGQIVISGAEEAVQRAMALAKERGAKRVIPLAVSIASHSPLMRSAVEGLRHAVASAAIRPAIVPVIANVTARPISSVEEIRQELVAQLTSSVRWIDSVQYMVGQGVSEFVEMGPKDVLTGLQKRIAPDSQITNWESQHGLAG